MVLSLSKVDAALEAKRNILTSLQACNSASLQDCLEKFSKLPNCDYQLFNQQIAEQIGQQNLTDFAGINLSKEIQKGICQPTLTECFSKSEQVDNWKNLILGERITIGIDGSQVKPDKNWGLPFGAVQVAWFVNYHSLHQKSIKELDFEIICSEKANLNEKSLSEEIDLRRFEKEAWHLAGLIKSLGNRSQYDKLPVAFFDGSLALSFMKDESLKRRYQTAVDYLWGVSKETQIPVVGFIDLSLARNLTKSLALVYNNPSLESVNDASLINQFCTNWGERSSFFHYLSNTQIGFCYLKNSSKSRKPVRLELPAWVYDQNLVQEIAQVVLAESLIGGDYPYPLEVADSVAVIKGAEKLKFYEYVQKKLNLPITESAKLQSKLNRRKTRITI